MYPSSDSFGKQVGDLSNTYTNYCGASCLFFWGDGSSHGLRIEAEFIAKEFVDNVEFGHGKPVGCDKPFVLTMPLLPIRS